MNNIWKIHLAGPDLYAVYRNGQLYHNMTSRQLEQDARFFRGHANLMRELDQNGEATREFGRKSIRQFIPRLPI